MPGAVVVNVPQKSPEWFAARCGRLTGTAAADMLATIRSGEAAARRDLRLRLVVERLTQRAQDEGGYVSSDMQWGIDHEPDARRAYEARTGAIVTAVGFLQHPELRVGCSPDGVVDGGRGIVEIKCPRSAQHLKSLRQVRAKCAVLPEYLPQLHHNLWVSGAQWCDFISYDPRFPPALQLAQLRVSMSAPERSSYELLVRQFLTEVEREYADVEGLLSAAVDPTEQPF